MTGAEARAIASAADAVADRWAINPCHALDVALDLVETIDLQLADLPFWQRVKARIRYAVVIPALRAIQSSLCG